RLCRVEAVEETPNALGIDADAVILDGKRGGFILDRRAQNYPALPRGDAFHRFDRVRDEVDENLLQLHRVRPDQRRRNRRLAADGDPLPFDRAAHQGEDAVNDPIQVYELLVLRFLAEQGADPRDHVGGAVTVGDDAARRLARGVEQRRIAL